jgi:hypothetical protein
MSLPQLAWCHRCDLKACPAIKQHGFSQMAHTSLQSVTEVVTPIGNRLGSSGVDGVHGHGRAQRLHACTLAPRHRLVCCPSLLHGSHARHLRRRPSHALPALY